MRNIKNHLVVRRLPLTLLAFSAGMGFLLLLLFFGHVEQALAGHPIQIDGDGSDWEPDDAVIVDIYDAIHSSDQTTATRFSPLLYARTGYEALTLSVHFNNDTWYFMINTDGRPGDVDSVGGSADNSGVGTTEFDSGLLSEIDDQGLGSGEVYQIRFDLNEDGFLDRRAQFGGNQEQPSTAYSTTGGSSIYAVGSAAYSGSYDPAGLVEFAIPKTEFFPPDQCNSSFDVRAHVGSSEDNVQDDTVPNLGYEHILDFDLDIDTMTSTHQNNPMTYTIFYTVRGHANIPAHNVVITQALDANSQFYACYGGESCSHSGGTVSWFLSTPITPGTPGASGVVTAAVTNQGPLSERNTLVQMRADEGICARADISHTPTSVALRGFQVETSPSWQLLGLAGAALVLVSISLGAFFAARRRQV